MLYRIVVTNPPTLDDMRSYQDLGVALRNDAPEWRRLASGISLFDSLERAREKARRKPWLGHAFIAEMTIPVDQVRIEKTAGPGHYTVWGEPSAMLGFVMRVERVEP
jgi:hypothetical protein